ncbi:MAG: hypothetical protein RIR48_436, partial [Bacteroidota bacterium]
MFCYEYFYYSYMCLDQVVLNHNNYLI